MKRFIFFQLCFLLYGTQVFAQTEWTRISPKPIESDLNEIVIIPGTNRMIAIGSGASILITDDLGANWQIQYKPGGISRSVALNSVCFVDSNIGFIAGTRSTILKTNDGGTTWQNILATGTEEFLDVYFLDELHGFVSKEDHIFRTSDGGVSWDTTMVETNTPKYIHFINDSVGFYGNTHHSYYFKTVNSGETWEQVEINPSIEDFSLTSILFLDNNIGFVSGDVSDMSSSDQYILKTVDGGLTWTQVYTDYFNSINQLYFYNADIGFAVGPRIMYDNMILRTTDGGSNWQECTMPSNGWFLTNLVFSEEGTGFCIGMRGQVLTSNDWGVNWERADYAAVHAATINDAQIVGDNTVYIAVTGYGGGVVSGSLSKSIDGGNTWSEILNSGDFTSLCFLNPNLGYALGMSYYGEFEINKTTDGGNSWESYLFEYEYNSPVCLYFANDSVGFIGSEWDPVIFKSTDEGNNWAITFSEYMYGSVSDFEFVTDSVGFAVGPYSESERFLLRTMDQGETWLVDTLDNLFYPTKIHFMNIDTGFISGSNNTILKTTDGGNTWYRVTTSLGNSAIFQEMIFTTDQTGYVLVEGDEVMIMKTTNGGETWEPIDFPCTSAPVAIDFFKEQRGLVVGNRGIIFKTFTFGPVDVAEFPEDYSEHTQWITYPNPVKDILHIALTSTEETDIQNFMFYDGQGKFITKVRQPGNTKIFDLDVSQWKNGAYYFNISSQGSSRKGGKFVIVNE